MYLRSKICVSNSSWTSRYRRTQQRVFGSADSTDRQIESTANEFVVRYFNVVLFLNKNMNVIGTRSDPTTARIRNMSYSISGQRSRC